MSNLASVATLIPPVELSCERVLLRPYRAEDATLVFAAARVSVDTVGRWMPWCHAGYTEAESIAWIEKAQAMWQSAEAYEFGMFDSANEYIGGAGINQFNRLHNLANLGYWVRQSRQRCGLATAAVQILARFGFETLGLTRIEIVAAIENGPSRRVAEKAGAQFECIARNRLIIAGVPHAAAIHSLVPTS
jgi:ribosomal-protein-serine acetyltransferase